MSERTVKISDDERGGWSSDRPRRDGKPERPVDISARCRVLKVSDRPRYSPGSLVVVVGGADDERERFVERVIEERGAVLSPAKVRALLADKVGADELDERAGQLLEAAVAKRLAAGDSTVVPVEGLDPQIRERLARAAHAKRRPRHIIYLDVTGAESGEDAQRAGNEMRRRLDDGELGAEGFQTAMRLSRGAMPEVKRILFRPPPSDDD